MNRLIAALALTPALFTTGAFAQTVSEDVTKQLWCGIAMITAFANPPEGLPEAQLAEAKGYFDGGLVLISDAEQAHIDAGFTQEAVDKLKTDLVAEITPVVTGAQDAGPGRFSFEDCLSILPGAPAADTSSSAQ